MTEEKSLRENEIPNQMIDRLKEIYGFYPLPHALDYIYRNYVEIAEDPHALDWLGYRIDRKFWWL